MTETIGFIGVGSQGGPMAHRIADAGMPLVVWARRSEVLGAYTAKGATAVIVRAAVVRLQEPGAARDSQAPSGEEIYRQTTRAGRHVSVDFN